MVLFNLTIETEGTSFKDAPATETARILRQVADKVKRGTLEGNCVDVNGDKVGEFHFEER